MTLNEYAAEVTAIIDRETCGNFDYPSRFEADMEICFMNRETPEHAAACYLGDAADDT